MLDPTHKLFDLTQQAQYMDNDSFCCSCKHLRRRINPSYGWCLVIDIKVSINSKIPCSKHILDESVKAESLSLAEYINQPLLRYKPKSFDMTSKNHKNSCRYYGNYVFGMCAIKKQAVYPVGTCIAFINKNQLSNFEKERIQDLTKSEFFTKKTRTNNGHCDCEDDTEKTQQLTVNKNIQSDNSYGLEIDNEQLFEMYFQSLREISDINKKINDVNSLIRDLMEVSDKKTSNILGIISKTLNG